MAKVIKRIYLTREEKECLEKAKEILTELHNDLYDEDISCYENYESITDIIDIYFEH